MPGFRGPNRNRINNQRGVIFRDAGQTATLRTFVSATVGDSFAGFGDTLSYNDRVITAMFGAFVLPGVPEVQQPGGMIANNMMTVTTRERVDRDDILLWQGETWRIESDPVKSVMDGNWQFQIKRSSP